MNDDDDRLSNDANPIDKFQGKKNRDFLHTLVH